MHLQNFQHLQHPVIQQQQKSSLERRRKDNIGWHPELITESTLILHGGWPQTRELVGQLLNATSSVSFWIVYQVDHRPHCLGVFMLFDVFIVLLLIAQMVSSVKSFVVFSFLVHKQSLSLLEPTNLGAENGKWIKMRYPQLFTCYLISCAFRWSVRVMSISPTSSFYPNLFNLYSIWIQCIYVLYLELSCDWIL